MTKRSIILILIAAALLVPSTDAAASVFKKKKKKAQTEATAAQKPAPKKKQTPLREADEGGCRFGLRKDVQSLPHVQGQDLYGLSKEYDGT